MAARMAGRADRRGGRRAVRGDPRRSAQVFSLYIIAVMDGIGASAGPIIAVAQTTPVVLQLDPRGMPPPE